VGTAAVSAVAVPFGGERLADGGQVGLFEAGRADLESAQVEVVAVGPGEQVPQRLGRVVSSDDQLAPLWARVGAETGR
jgi:hypothetical protein